MMINLFWVSWGFEFGRQKGPIDFVDNPLHFIFKPIICKYEKLNLKTIIINKMILCKSNSMLLLMTRKKCSLINFIESSKVN